MTSTTCSPVEVFPTPFVYSIRAYNIVYFDEPADASVVGSNVQDPYDRVYSNIPNSTHVLKHMVDYDKCGAKRFQYETKGFCCRNGQISLSDPEPPPELRRLWSSADSDARHFWDNIRFFNGHFSFTTLDVSFDENYTNMRSGVYTFRAHSQIYHNVHSFGPSDSGPNHLELYFYDNDPSLNHRFRHSPSLDQEVVRRLVGILRDNPYSQTFRSLGQAVDLEEFRVSLNTDLKMDQRVYNRPITSEVAAVWVEGKELRREFNPSVILYGNNNEKCNIKPYYRCYDLVSYPLFFPRGELGWHPEIPKYGVPMEAVIGASDNNNENNNDEGSG